MKSPDEEYKKQVAVIIPKWCLDMLVNQLDMQFDSLQQEQAYYEQLNDEERYDDITKELALYSSAFQQLVSQINDI